MKQFHHHTPNPRSIDSILHLFYENKSHQMGQDPAKAMPSHTRIQRGMSSIHRFLPAGEAMSTPDLKQAAKQDLFQLFAEKVRDNKEFESRWAVLQDMCAEYFRGKDFVSFLKNHPEVKDILESNKNIEIEEIANVLLSKNLLVCCDRVVKTLRVACPFEDLL